MNNKPKQTLTDEHVKQIILRASKGDEIAQFYFQQLRNKGDGICREQFLRVEEQIRKEN